MISEISPTSSLTFPKSARLLRPRQFQFKNYKVRDFEHFRIVFSPIGSGRIGISISKKAIKAAVGRNRVRRLVKEVFRQQGLTRSHWDIHVVGLRSLGQAWKSLSLDHVGKCFEIFN